jgi:vacuolar-type H+-ATPase subunit F/Vma7
MGAIVFIGDELTAAGFRLTGIDTLVPAPMNASEAFVAARQRADLIIITAQAAKWLPPAELEAALLAEAPIVAVVADIRSQTAPPDLTRRLRGALGIEL